MNHIEEQLLTLKTFTKPKANLEQYTTPASIATRIVDEWKEEIVGKTVLDLGAGTGMLGIAALLVGAKRAIFIEKDEEAVMVLKENLANLGLAEKAEVLTASIHMTDIEADTTIMNPPFGTRKEHADRDFLDYALSHSNFVISLHKTNTLDAIKKHIEGLKAKVVKVEDIKYVLKHTMDHHTREKQAIEVSLVTSQNI